MSRRLQSGLKDHGFRGRLLMMLANGLVQVVDECVDRAVYLLNSGPAAAPSAATYLGGLHGKNNLLSMDMGGTSFDVCVIKDGEIPTTTEFLGRRASRRDQDGRRSHGRRRRRLAGPHRFARPAAGRPAERRRRSRARPPTARARTPP